MKIIEKILLKMMPEFVERVAVLEDKLNTERLARKNEVNRVEKELSKDWVGEEIEKAEKEAIIKSIENKELIDEKIINTDKI